MRDMIYLSFSVWPDNDKRILPNIKYDTSEGQR